jgi:hypothetical protein
MTIENPALRCGVESLARDPVDGPQAASMLVRLLLALPCSLRGSNELAPHNCKAVHTSALALLDLLLTPHLQAFAARDSAQLARAVWAPAARQALLLVPHMALVLPRLPADDPADLQDVAALCVHYARVLAMVVAAAATPAVSSEEELTVWVKAADAALRMLPCLDRLAPRCPAGSRGRAGILSLAATLLEGFWMLGGVSCENWRPSAAPAPQTTDQQWALHSRSCRMVHWLAAEPGRACRLPWDLGPRRWSQLRDGLHAWAQTLHTALDVAAQASHISGTSAGAVAGPAGAAKEYVIR